MLAMKIKAAPITLFSLYLILILVFIGELYRFHGFLLLDFLIPIVAGAYLLINFVQNKSLKPLPVTLAPALLFWLIGLSSLLINSDGMSYGEILNAAFYGARWISYFFLSVMVFRLSLPQKDLIKFGLFGLALLIALAGFIQLIIMPDFTNMEILGWDPHQNRLLSTWFDPNFVGGFLAFMTPLVLGEALDNKKRRLLLFAIAAILALAVLLTLSRSAYLALLAALFIFGLFRSKKLLAAGAVVFCLAILFIPPVQDRFESLIQSAESVFTETYTLPDASARLRFASWEEGWDLFLEKPLLGQGYNRYKFAALKLGTINDTNIHSASGSDFSFLNILATSGILGFLPFFAIYLILTLDSLQRRQTAFSVAFFASLCGLMIHAIFVNSLLFPLFMAPFWMVAGLISPEKQALKSL